MTKNKIAQVVFGVPVDKSFDYRIPDSMAAAVCVGQRVRAPFRESKLTGIVVGLKGRSPFKQLKSLIAVLDPYPVLDGRALAFTKSFAAMYGCSWGEAIEAGLPAALRAGKSLEFELPPPTGRPAAAKNLLTVCLDEGLQARWPVITRRVQETLSAGKGVLFLVPEAYLIGHAEAKLRDHVPEPLTRLDKHLTAKQEAQNWLAVKEGKVRLVIGTRSAVFAPLHDPGLIIVYDEENPAYKQEQTPFYHARDVVLLRSRLEQCPVLFVSCAPSVELWRIGRQKNMSRIVFKEDRPAQVKMIDLLNYKMPKKTGISFPLQNAVRDVLSRQGKVVLLLNRRGFSTMIRCSKCGHTVRCARCEVNLSFRYNQKKLICPLCQTSSALPEACPQCRTAYLRYWGAGIEKIESEAARLFPGARVARYDRETPELPPQADIIVATQAVLRLAGEFSAEVVAVLDVDAELSRVDFRASQKIFTLLTRLRQMAKETLYVQTCWKDYPCFQAVVKRDPAKFYRDELGLRKECRLPPFVHLVAFCCRGVQKQKVCDRAKELFEMLKERGKDGIEVMDPQPDIIPKLRDKYRFTIMLKGRSLNRIMALVKAVSRRVKRKGRIIETVNVDP